MHATLHGRDHPDLGDVAVAPLGPLAALALTRGEHPKAYDHVDPNEDAAAIVLGPRAALLVVADGHNGADAAEVAVATVLRAVGSDPRPADLTDVELVDLMDQVNARVRGHAEQLRHPRSRSRTTLLVAWVADEGDRRRIEYAGIGDSALMVVVDGVGRELTRARNRFVGYEMSRYEVAGVLDRGTVTVPAASWVAAVTDGFTNFVGPAAAADVTAELAASATDAAALGTAMIARAGKLGAGDNIAVAALGPRT